MLKMPSVFSIRDVQSRELGTNLCPSADALALITLSRTVHPAKQCTSRPVNFLGELKVNSLRGRGRSDRC